MYDIISSIIDHTWTTGSSDQQYIMYVCSVMIPLISVVIVDTFRMVFRAFIRR